MTEIGFWNIDIVSVILGYDVMILLQYEGRLHATNNRVDHNNVS